MLRGHGPTIPAARLVVPAGWEYARSSVVSLAMDDEQREVHFKTNDEDDAARVTAVLEALGFTVHRTLDEDQSLVRVSWAASRLARRHGLSSREESVLDRLLAGRPNDGIAADLAFSRGTVTWLLHNIFHKTGTATREQLLRLALQLPIGSAEPDQDLPLPSC
jgi:DNA-binding CsgD family transcriptional regulator